MSEEKSEWIPWKNNPVIEYNSTTKVFRCKEHPEFKTATNQGAGQHSKSHGYYLDGAKIEAKTKQKEKVEGSQTEDKEPETQEPEESDEEKALGERIAEVESKLGQVEGKREGAIDIVEQSSVRMAQDIAETATKVATNVRLQFMYYITKKCHVFPIDMTFDEWIDANVTDSLKNRWHVHIDFWTDLKKLEPMQLKVIKQNIKDYRNMMARQAQSGEVC